MFHLKSKSKPRQKNATEVIIGPSLTEIGTAEYADYGSLTSVIFTTVTEVASSVPSVPLAGVVATLSVTGTGARTMTRTTAILPPPLPSPATSTSASATGLTKIGRYAFRCCTSLKSITIPPTVTEIGYGAFMGCSSLTSIQIPHSVEIIHRFAFAHCSSLIAVSFSTSSPSSSPPLSSSSTTKSSSTATATATMRKRTGNSNNSNNNKNHSLQICSAAFNNCKSLILIGIPKNTTFVVPPNGYDARNPPPFSQCAKLERIFMRLRCENNNNININMNSSAASMRMSNQNTNWNSSNNSDSTSTNTSTSIISSNGTTSLKTMDMNTWLEERFHNLPLHEICCDPDVTIEQLTSFIQTFHRGENEASNTSKCNDGDKNVRDGPPPDAMGMTPLHILACNPNITPEMIQLIIETYPSSTSMEDKHSMTPLKLYLSCNNLSPFDLRINNKNKNSTTASTTNITGKNSNISINNNNGLIVSLDHILEYYDNDKLAVDWNVIENILAFQSMSQEQGRKDDQSGLYPFMKAAIFPQCNLNVVYNLALYNVELLQNAENTALENVFVEE